MEIQESQETIHKGVTLQNDTLIVKDDRGYIVYSPFTGLIARAKQFPERESKLYNQLAAQGFFQAVPETTRRDEQWNGFFSLTLLLTRSCNLGCSYCYASAKPGGESMPLDLAIGSLDWFVGQLSATHTVRITFHGGGEPTLEKETIRSVVAHSERIRGARKAQYIITTNGTAERSFMDWLMEHQFGISISMDGPPEIQDRNRPLVIIDEQCGQSSPLVEANVRYLVSKKYPFSIRLTYSPSDDIAEIVRYFAQLGVKKLHLEPLFPHGRLYRNVEFGKKSQYEVYSPVAGELLKKFLEAVDLCKEYGIRVHNGHFANFTKGIGYFCGAASGRAMVVGHDGLLTGCLEVVDSKDKDVDAFNVGRWISEERRFNIDFSKMAMFQARHADALPECKDCFARYTCAGGCAVKAVRASGDFFDRDIPYCGFTRGLVPILVKRIAKASNI